MMKRVGLWYHGWNVVAICVTALTFSLVLTLNCLSMFMPVWTKEFGVPVSTLALSVTLFSIATVVVCYPVGIWVGRYSPRLIYGAGLVVLGVAHLLVSASHAVWQILAIYAVLVPMATALCGAIPAQSLVSQWFVRRVGLAMGLTAAGLALPGLLFPPIIVALLRIMDWRMIWAGFGLVILLVVLPIAMLILRGRTEADDAYGYREPTHRAGDQGLALPLGQILSRLNFWVILGCFLSVQVIPMMLFVNITPIIRSYGGSTALGGWFLVSFSVVAMIAKLTAGWLADRIGSRVPFAVSAAVAGAGALLLAVPSTNPVYLLGVAAMIGFAGATWTLLASCVLGEFGQSSFSRAYAFASAAAPFSTFSGPIVAKIQEMTGSYSAPLTALGVISLAASVAFLLLFRAQPRRPVLQPA